MHTFNYIIEKSKLLEKRNHQKRNRLKKIGRLEEKEV